MGPLLLNAVAVNDENTAGRADGGQAVGDDEGGAALCQLVKGGLDAGLGDRVQGGGGLVQNKDGRIFQENAGNGHPLLLAAGEHGAPLAHLGLEAVGHVQDVVVDLRPLGGLHDLGLGGVRPAVADVVVDGAGKEKDILLDDPDIGPQGVLGEGAHVLSVHQHPAPGDIVEPGDELAQGGLAAAGGAHHRHSLAGPDVEGDVLQHRRIGGLIPEGHVLHPDVPLHVGELLGVRLVLDVGLHPHQGHKPLEARHALHKLLHEGGELADGGDEGGDVEEEGGQVDEIHPPPHEQESAEGDDNHGQDAHEELHTRLIEGHGPVVAPLGPPELVVGLVEFGALRRLVGEGLGGTHAGDGGLNLPVNARQLGLHLSGGSHHPLAAQGGEQDEQGDYRKYDQGQLPPDGEHDAEGPQDGDGGDEQILRAVVGQLGDLKQVAGDPAHELAGAVFVIEGKGQILHVGEQIPPYVGLHPYPQQMPPVGDDIVKAPLEHVSPGQHRHYHEKRREHLSGQQRLHGKARDDGEGQVHQADAQGTHHIQCKQLPVGPVIRGEYPQISVRFPPLLLHLTTPLCRSIVISGRAVRRAAGMALLF